MSLSSLSLCTWALYVSLCSLSVYMGTIHVPLLSLCFVLAARPPGYYTCSSVCYHWVLYMSLCYDCVPGYYACPSVCYHCVPEYETCSSVHYRCFVLAERPPGYYTRSSVCYHLVLYMSLSSLSLCTWALYLSLCSLSMCTWVLYMFLCSLSLCFVLAAGPPGYYTCPSVCYHHCILFWQQCHSDTRIYILLFLIFAIFVAPRPSRYSCICPSVHYGDILLWQQGQSGVLTAECPAVMLSLSKAVKGSDF